MFEFFQVKLVGRAPHEALGFQLQLDGCEHEVLECQDQVNLVVNQPIRGMPGCCPCGGGECWQGWVSGSLRTQGVSILSFCLYSARSSYCPCPVFVCFRAYFDIPVALNYWYILLGSLCYDTIKLLLELLGLLVFVVWDWCTDLDDYVVWSNWNLDGDESAGDGSAADDTTCSFFPYSECHPILVFRVFSAPLGLASLICGSFSKPCPSDLGKAQDVPWIAF